MDSGYGGHLSVCRSLLKIQQRDGLWSPGARVYGRGRRFVCPRALRTNLGTRSSKSFLTSEPSTNSGVLMNHNLVWTRLVKITYRLLEQNPSVPRLWPVTSGLLVYAGLYLRLIYILEDDQQ